MGEFLSDMDLRNSFMKAFEKFVEDGIRFEDIKSETVGKLMYKFYVRLFESLGIKVELFEKIFLYADEKDKRILEDRLTSFEMLFFLLPMYEVDKEFSLKIDKLFEICKRKDSVRLEEIFLNPRVEMMRMMLSNFRIHWMYLEGEDLSREDILDKKFSIIKYLSDSMYRELLFVFQEMLQIAFDYPPVDDCDVVIQEMRSAPIDLSIFVNETVCNIHKTENYENIGVEEDNLVALYDKDNNVIRLLKEEDINKARSWLKAFIRNVFHSLRKNYFEWKDFDFDIENRIVYLMEILLLDRLDVR